MTHAWPHENVSCWNNRDYDRRTYSPAAGFCIVKAMKSKRFRIALATLALTLIAVGALPAIAQAEDADTNTVPLLVVVVGFDASSDGKTAAVAYDDSYDWGETIFGADNSLASYYLDMSNGKFTFSPAAETCSHDSDGVTSSTDRVDDGVVHVTLKRAHGRWGLVNEKNEVAQDFGRAVLEAFQLASSYVDFKSYDSNGDGMITPDELAIAVCIAGYDASPFDDPDRTDIPVLWPHAGKLANEGGEEEVVDGVRFDSYIAMAEYLSFDAGKPQEKEQEPLGILYHELGHYLGLPDLYPLNADAEDEPWGAYRVGTLSLMANGNWALVEDPESPNGSRYEPTALDAWCRYVLGWKNPGIVTESGSYALSSELSDSGYSQLLIPTSDPNQYYLLENRLPEGHDIGLVGEYGDGNPRGGIVVWHIDKGIYRQYGQENDVNNTDHAPAVMELFFESYKGSYSTDWSHSVPVTEEPFYDSASCEANFGSSSTTIKLPLYRGENGGTPSSRANSQVTVQFPTNAARDMTVHIEFDSTVAGTSSKAYPLDGKEFNDLRMGKGALGSIAGTALVEETNADVGIVDAQSVSKGLPAGDITYAQAYDVLSSDSNIACYNLTGAQLVELVESSINVSEQRRRCLAVLDALEEVDFIDHIPEVDAKIPSADAALNFGGLSYGVNWNGAIGARSSSITIGGEPIDLNRAYYVAVAPGVVEQYDDFFDDLSPDILMLWGSPKDAMRSFIETPDWERTALAE